MRILFEKELDVVAGGLAMLPATFATKAIVGAGAGTKKSAKAVPHGMTPMEEPGPPVIGGLGGSDDGGGNSGDGGGDGGGGGGDGGSSGSSGSGNGSGNGAGSLTAMDNTLAAGGAVDFACHPSGGGNTTCVFGTASNFQVQVTDSSGTIISDTTVCQHLDLDAIAGINLLNALKSGKQLSRI